MLVLLGTAFLTTFVIQLLLRHAAPKLGLLDHASEHRHHRMPAALVGGLSIFAGCGFSILLLELPVGEFRPLLLGGAILVLIGVLDDVHDLPWWSRFTAQVLATLLMIFMGGVQLHDLGNLVGTGGVGLGPFSVMVTLLATVGFINAYNMIDGIDGLAGSLILIPIVGLYLFSGDGMFGGPGQMLLLVAGGLVAFLTLNFPFRWRPQATVFLGDAGSMFLGFLLCWFMISLSQGGGARVIDPVTALWLAAVPLLDTATVVIRRVSLGLVPFRADRTHIHHLLQHAGLGRFAVVLTIISIAILAAVFGFLGEYLDWPVWLRFASFCLSFVVYFLWTSRYTRLHGLAPSVKRNRGESVSG